ncbi:MAG TPA: hypothetical protein DCY07_05315 [Rhodospirillaceae bacterium]|nr:hypothetical protein [Rhodospirillaceae bacterium]
MAYNASTFNSPSLNAMATNSSLIYQRDVSIAMNSTLEDANILGTLATNQTQLDIKGQLSRENSTHFYKYTLDGDNLKLAFVNNTASSNIRLQILNSSGKVVADSSETATQTLRDAYKNAASWDGLDQKAGDYYIKVTFDAAAFRAVPQKYSVAMYSGTRFSTSYQTTAKTQTSTRQAVLVDNTMTYSLIDAKAYETKASHVANETKAEAVNIGWIFADKSALSVTSRLTDVCSVQYYSLMLQKGDNLKLTYNNKTATSDTRVQLYDSSGTKLYADSQGTAAQKEAYKTLTGPDGVAVDPGQFLIKISYMPGEEKKEQLYDLKVFSGTSYTALYKTIAATQSWDDALATGRIGTAYSMQNVLASYLTTMSQGEETSIIDTLSQTV